MDFIDEKIRETIVINLPLDLISEILSRLSVKSLLRFKCVSKYWYSFIESEDFIKLHLNKSKESDGNSTCIIVSRSSLHSFDFNSSDHSTTCLHYPHHWPRSGKAPRVELIGSCNGLICLYEWGKRTFSLYNPATRVYKQLPEIEDKMSEENYSFLCNRGDFCYDCVAHDYKVFSFISYFDEVHDMVGEESHAFSLKSKSWEKISNPPSDINQMHSVFTNNFLHWLVSDDESNFILRMNVSTRRYDTMLLPTEYDEDKPNLVVLKGYLQLLTDMADIWMMKEYGVEQSWTKLFDGNSFQFDLSFWALPYAYSKDGRKIIIGIEERPVTFVCCDLDSQTGTQYVIEGLPTSMFIMEPWVESLVSPT